MGASEGMQACLGLGKIGFFNFANFEILCTKFLIDFDKQITNQFGNKYFQIGSATN